jgi:NAD+ synthase (glutamine-hydrolysing)
MKIRIAQIDPTVGDIKGNLKKHVTLLEKASRLEEDLVVFPELSLCGYPPKDLLLHPNFVNAILQAEADLVAATKGTKVGLIFGSVRRTLWPNSKNLQNVAVFAHDGGILGKVAKRLLPTYDVFDEARYFEPGRDSVPIQFMGRKLGICVCEDLWNDKYFWQTRLYEVDPVRELALNGAEAIINISSSPFSVGKHALRKKMLTHAAKRHNLPIVYVNQVGGNDDVIYDGGSMVLAPDGNILVECASFMYDNIPVEPFAPPSTLQSYPEYSEISEVYEALLLGTRDYVHKCGFKKVVLGLSGGIDSAVVAAIARFALGGDNVLGVAMPSKFSSDGSVADAKALADKLGICFDILPIKGVHDAYKDMLCNLSEEKDKVELWEENIQARIRGATLMAISNKENRLLLTTGNKSEIAMGYCTLYGDTCGGLAVISDVFKTQVFELARHINSVSGNVIPESTITKPPSAELRPGQYDQETLPPYPLLDSILMLYIENEDSLEEIASKTNQSLDFVKGIIRKVDANEYKRKQLAPGLRITRKAFGCGRVMPIAQGWKL